MSCDSDSDVDTSWVELAGTSSTAKQREISSPSKVEEIDDSDVSSDDSDVYFDALPDITEAPPPARCKKIAPEIPDPRTGMRVGKAGNLEKMRHPPKTSSEGRCICSGCWNYNMTPLMAEGRASCLTERVQGDRLRCRWRDRRPYSEPAMFDYDRFTKEFIPSDKMILEMFPSDPVGRTAYRDGQTEVELLNMFLDWGKGAKTRVSIHDSNVFHHGLIAELEVDLQSVDTEFDAIVQSLTELQKWQKSYLDMDGELVFAQSELNRGKNIFCGPGGRQAQAKYAHLLGIPNDDIATWEMFHLNSSTRRTARVRDMLYAGEPLFEPEYFGGVAAREKWGYVVWERFRTPATLKVMNVDLRAGKDIFASDFLLDDCAAFANASAITKWKKKVSRWGRRAEHDLESWEGFHLDNYGGVTKIRLGLEALEPLFESKYFGGVDARAKWGYLQWELDQWPEPHVEYPYAPRTIESRLQKGMDVLGSPNSLRTSPEWACESAKARYEHLVDMLSRPPKHDLQTWEWFHLDENGGTTKTRRALGEGASLFQALYFGGVEARAKWGYLAPKWQRQHWSTEERRIAEDTEAKMGYDSEL